MLAGTKQGVDFEAVEEAEEDGAEREMNRTMFVEGFDADASANSITSTMSGEGSMAAETVLKAAGAAVLVDHGRPQVLLGPATLL